MVPRAADAIARPARDVIPILPGMQRIRLATVIALVLAATVAAAGCGGGGKSGSPGPEPAMPGQVEASVFNDPSRFVLAAEDMPEGYTVDRTNTRAIANADAAKGHDDAYLRQLLSWGRIAGYASGWLPGGSDATGPLQVQSSASTFETVGGAVDAFAQGLKEVGTKYKQVDPDETIGEESRMWTSSLDNGEVPLTVYAMAWRSGRVLATIAVTGRTGRASADDALAYAQKQQARITGVATKAIGK